MESEVRTSQHKGWAHVLVNALKTLQCGLHPTLRVVLIHSTYAQDEARVRLAKQA